MSYNPKLIWIHCNICYEHYIRKERRFFLLACKHVLCENCCKINMDRNCSDTPTYNCALCRMDARGREMGNSLPPHLKELFHPEPWVLGTNMQEVITFQKVHQDNFYKHRLKIEKRKAETELATKMLRESCKKQYLELEQLRTQRKQLEHRVVKIKKQRQREKQLSAQRQHGVSASHLHQINEAYFKLNPFDSTTTYRARYPNSNYSNAAGGCFNTGPRMPHPSARSHHDEAKKKVTSFSIPPNYSFQL